MIREYRLMTTYPYGANIFMVCENEMLHLIQKKSLYLKINHHKHLDMNHMHLDVNC